MMAKFKIGDWVQITPKPDRAWRVWNNESHDPFCGEIGQITDIQEDPEHTDKPDEDIVKIVVKFNEDLFKRGCFKYWQWFKKRHLILSSPTKASSLFNLRESGKKLQEWEEVKKKKTDEMWKKKFGSEKVDTKITPSPVDLSDPWEEKTPVVPLPDSSDMNFPDLDADLQELIDHLDDLDNPFI